MTIWQGAPAGDSEGNGEVGESAPRPTRATGQTPGKGGTTNEGGNDASRAPATPTIAMPRGGEGGRLVGRGGNGAKSVRDEDDEVPGDADDSADNDNTTSGGRGFEGKGPLRPPEDAEER